MRTAFVVQARTGSTRLPGKVLQDIAGAPMLARVIERIERCVSADVVVVATTTSRRDDAVAEIAASVGAEVFRGSEEDVLARYAGAAREVEADVVVRVTSDCPLLEPEVADRVVETLTQPGNGVDYASNILDRTYPRGLDVEAFFADVLFRMDRLAFTAPSREHVTRFILIERPELFLTASVTDSTDNSDLRWTVDELLDLELVRDIYETLRLHEQPMPYTALLRRVRRTPAWIAHNAAVRQKNV